MSARKKPTPKEPDIDLSALSLPDLYTVNTWLAHEAMHNGMPINAEFATEIEPHPNEIAARQAVADGVISAEEYGL